MARQQQATAQRQIIGTKSISSKVSKSSKSSKKEEPKMNAELKRLAATQAEEDAIFESEMEKKKIEIEFQTREKVKKLKAEAALAERKAELIQEYDSDDMSSSNDENGSDRLPPPPITQLIKGEQTDLWVKSCSSQTADNQALDNLESPERVNYATINPRNILKTRVIEIKWKQIPLVKRNMSHLMSAGNIDRVQESYRKLVKTSFRMLKQ